MTTLQKKTVGYLGSRPPSCVQHTIFSRIGQATLLKGCVQDLGRELRKHSGKGPEKR